MYFIPGIGQVAITVTGAVVIGGTTIAAGSWLYNKVTAYFGKKDAEEAASKIPKSLKKTNMQVDLSKFKDKNGRTPANKSSGIFTNGKWSITKDDTGHLGYNGNKKAWKITKKEILSEQDHWTAMVISSINKKEFYYENKHIF
ncbi:hypothetical protein [Exiguobacterium sp. s154]|uniref:hypothetical protein n=1 Tax=Exiguobacterium sp. s154 TaxID=2751277 RepID=UPI001BE6BFC9|nr:hypothetical protein [Exiguobacterium sp. s154]